MCKKGNISIRLLISIFIIMVFLAYGIKQLEPIKIYRDLKSCGRDIALKMEINGGVTETDLSDLKSKIKSMDLYISNLKINPETTMTSSIKYGDEVLISFTYIYKYKDIEITKNNIIPHLVEKTYIMPVKFSSTSRKGR